MSYVKNAWDFVSQTSIKNAFVKAELMNLEPELEASNEVDDLCTEFSKAMEFLNLSVNPSKVEEFVHIDNEDNEKYATVVLEDVEELLEKMKIVRETRLPGSSFPGFRETRQFCEVFLK